MPRKLSADKLLVRLLESSDKPVYLLDSQRRIVFANEALAAWLGQPLSELVGVRCDFSATPHEEAAATSATPPSQLNAALGPPPEVFQGTAVGGYVVAPVDAGRVRATEFLPIQKADGDDGWHVLAVVHGEPVDAGQTDDAGPAAKNALVLHAQLLRLRQQWSRRYRHSQIIGISPASQRVREQIHLAAQGARGVVIIGPAGSGREHVARTIHYGVGGDTGPLVPIECPLVDAEAMQASLAAFVKAQAKGKGQQGAILLLDADRLRPDAQNELAEFLKLPGIELAIRSTARRSLLRMADRGRFRQDLAYTLSTFEIVLPPLAKRPEDVPLLAQHFVEQFNALGGKQLSGFTSDALEKLTEYDWPGNAAELAEMVRAACDRGVGPYLLAADLPDRLQHAAVAAAHRPRPAEPIQLDEFLAGIERELMERAMKAAKGNKTKAAELLGIHRARLIRRLVQLGLVEAPAEVVPVDEPVIFEPLPDAE